MVATALALTDDEARLKSIIREVLNEPGLRVVGEEGRGFDKDAITAKAVAIARLRDPFLPHQIGKKPQPLRKDSEKARCNVCGGFHGMPALHLDYVGHAQVTERILEVDPAYEFGPLAFDPNGSPIVDRVNGSVSGMWCRLSILGMVRVEYADGPNQKELMSDGIRRCAMRFGVALDLWKKEGERGANGEAAAPRKPTAVELGWSTKEEANQRHKEVGHKMEALHDQAKDQLASYRSERGLFGWPLTPDQLAEVETWVDEWNSSAEPY